MALGIEIFRQNFAEYQDQYVLIGGMACDLILDEIGDEFRPTKDIDMVLIVEALTNDFANAFWKFIEKGGYEPRHRKDGKAEFYRFVNPKEVGYPLMIELFARPDSEVAFSYTGHLVPLHIDDDISSLSAILLNDAYYKFMLEGKIVAEGVSVVDAVHLVPLKMKAWLDLKDQKVKGLHVNDRDLRKHRQDIFRLFPLIDGNATIVVPKEVHDDVRAFIYAVREMDFDIRQIGIDTSKEEILNIYEEIYVVER